MGETDDREGASPALPQRDRYAPRAQKPIPRWRTTLFPTLAAPLALLFRLYLATMRFRVHGEENLEPFLSAGQRFIPCVWHQRQIMAVAYMRRLRARGVTPGALVSPSKDGELAARVLGWLGVQAVRGSGRRSGAQALRDMYLAIQEGDVSP
ncbi:MAG: DUF374 domain-containing protein, partial [Planctomycetota bacterium]